MRTNSATPNKPIPTPSDQELQAELLGIASTKKPSSSRIGTWLNWLFVIVVLMAISLAYYFDYVSAAWLSRISIIIGACSAFMITPELIGEQRLQRLDEHYSSIRKSVIERNKILAQFISIKSFGLVYYCLIFYGPFVYSFLVINYFVLFSNIYAVTSLLTLTGILFYLSFRYSWRLLLKRKDILVKRYGDEAKFSYDALGTVYLLLSLPYISLVSLSAIYVLLPLAQFIKLLVRDSKLRNFLMRWGFRFLILSVLLQLITTF